jgi:hypothetical protein
VDIQVGKPVKIQTDTRYVEHNRDYAIGDVYDALVELITNCDDSYNNLFQDQKRARDGGDILIEQLKQRKGQASYLVVRDRAQGMDSNRMKSALLRMGAHSSEAGNRGYMGRGAKDCSALGDVVFESIKDDRYYRCRITHDLNFVLEADGKTANQSERKRLGIPRGNGTSVILELAPNVRVPRLDSLAQELPWHYALRDILAVDSDSRALLRKIGTNGHSSLPLVYRPPEGELVLDEEFDVEGYPVARARLRIWKAPEPLQDSNPRFERFGIIIKGRRAIHECSLLADEFKKNPMARRYFGRLECSFIDQLMLDYETDRKLRRQHPDENPCLVVDPNRRTGLERRHPFVRRLLQIPTERLRALIAKDREQERVEQREIANQETRNRLDRLAKLASQFLREQLDELEELGAGDALDAEMFAKQGVLIYPTYLNVAVGTERTLTVYVKRSLLLNSDEAVMIQSTSPDKVEIIGSPFVLHAHKTKTDRLLGSFRVKGKKTDDQPVALIARCNGLPAVEAKVRVVEHKIEQHDFQALLEFERPEYHVRQGSRKSLHLFAKYPDVIAGQAEANVTSSDGSKVGVRGRCVLTPVVGSNYAEASILIEGRTLKSKAEITAEINGRKAMTVVKVIAKSDDDRSIPIQINIRDEDYGNFRAMWAKHEGKPNLLLISARHKSLARYLGAPPDFPGQDTALFRLLIAEIVAESVCRKALVMEAEERPWDFRWADLKEDHLIADDVLAKMQQRIREFVANAHASMLSDQDVKTALR